MKALLFLAKAAISFVWLILLVNIVSPFPGNAAIVLYIMTAFFVHHAWTANADLRRRLW